ncbi:YcxB family protein [Catellatospora bangladeshensis]|uniref:YcxB family protein n=1 Tax=Catellatospora bangladeshensis TaxID=310355 RepID=A0A8J3NNG2_9ACTN|nr:YcxB family protein [Catellatospora bangladeshensis]GIF86291.1 hypothetical protein Cba03nite_76400 [Catellatospora bangladeshensis]
MRIEFTFSRSPEYFRQQLKADAKRAVRRDVLRAVVLAVVGVVFVFISQGEGVALVVGAVALLAALSLPWRAWQVFKAAVTVPAAWCGPRSWVVTDEGVESSTDLTSTRWSWQAVLRVEERPNAYLLWQDGPAMFDLPREPLTAVEDAEIRAFLLDRGLLRP